jgi:hypothetical protein
MTYQEMLSFIEFANEKADEELNKYDSVSDARAILRFAFYVLDREVGVCQSTPIGCAMPLTLDECKSIIDLSGELLTKSRNIGRADE